MTKAKRVVFALATATMTIVVSGSALLAVDIYLHSKFQTSAALNIWGYRGPVIGGKAQGEYRIVVLGGSSAFGYGVTWDQAMPAQLERRLAATAAPGSSYRVVNLGYNNEGAYSFSFTLRDYDRLNYDLACLYEGYNDLSGDAERPNLSVFRHDSPVFRLTGYMPIFPIVFKEKAAAMLAGGDPGALYRSGDSPKTVFRPPLPTQAAAAVLRTTGEIGQSLEQQLGRVVAEAPRQIGPADATGCKYPWTQYCRSIAAAVTLALSRNRQVLFVTQPYESVSAFVRARHIEQQREAAAMLTRRFGGDRRVNYVNLGEAADLNDPSISFDHMHLMAAGNEVIADRLVAPVLEMAARRAADRQGRN
jgi:lysophospholipase L1-like esterase